MLSKDEMFNDSMRNSDLTDLSIGPESIHMTYLNQYLEEEKVNRQNMISVLNKNMQNIKTQLEDKSNFRKFYWSPDYHNYGFKEH